MVWGAEGAGANEATASGQQASDAVDFAGLDGFPERKRRQDTGKALGQHGLAGTGRTDHQNVMSAGGSHLQSAAGSGLAADIAERLEERNSLIKACNERPKVFIICAVEAMEIAQAIQFQFQHAEADFKIWSDQVFKASQYPIEALQDVLDESDFAIAIASPEDLVQVRGEAVTQPRDNVLVELGMSLGRLGRRRSMLLVPRKSHVSLPSDFKGLTPIQYEDGPLADLPRLVGPACFEIKTVIAEFGVRTDR